MTTPSPLDHRLKTLTLGATTLTAATAGLSLPEKAEASIALPSGFYANTDPITVSNSVFLNISLDLDNVTEPIAINSFFNNGWNFIALSASSGSGINIFQSGQSTGLYTYFFFSFYYTESQTFNLADFSSGFLYTTNSFSFLAPGDYYFGLRRAGGATGDINGWTKLTLASISHVQTVFNINPGGPSNITIGQVPEPSTALLLAAGSASLLTARRRRKK
ncbi:MAG: PEP-CTERM sorting domain-containing protein [Verrucomicrobiota bacterium]